jgi:DNA polymerase III delta' subunit
MQRIIGHERILDFFRRLVTSERLGHSYILSGPESVGKSSVATWIAALVLCTGATSPCGECASCRSIALGTHADVHRVSSPEPIRVDAIRVWNDGLWRTSLWGGWRIGILEGVDTCTESAANAALKTIEEPPARTLLLLTARHARTVLPTIASRCALVTLGTVATPSIVDWLEQSGVSGEIATTAASMAGGRPGFAKRYAEDEDFRQAHEIQRATATSMVDGGALERLQAVERLVGQFPKVRSPEDRAAHRALVAAYLDHVYVVVRQRHRETSGQSDARTWIPVLHVLARARRALDGNVSPRAIFEAIALTYPFVS